MTLRLGCACAGCRGMREQGREVWPSPTSPLPLRIDDAELHGAWGLRITWNDTTPPASSRSKRYANWHEASSAGEFSALRQPGVAPRDAIPKGMQRCASWLSRSRSSTTWCSATTLIFRAQVHVVRRRVLRPPQRLRIVLRHRVQAGRGRQRRHTAHVHDRVARGAGHSRAVRGRRHRLRRRRRCAATSSTPSPIPITCRPA